jgi:hypothetical protein
MSENDFQGHFCPICHISMIPRIIYNCGNPVTTYFCTCCGKTEDLPTVSVSNRTVPLPESEWSVSNRTNIN